DVRAEADYNRFHIANAQRVEPGLVVDLSPDLQLQPPNTVFVLMSNDETAATEAWKMLTAESVPNVYILEGGINAWLQTFAVEDQRIQALSAPGEDQLRYLFPAALGSSYAAARPDPGAYPLEFIPKIELKTKKEAGGGGC